MRNALFIFLGLLLLPAQTACCMDLLAAYRLALQQDPQLRAEYFQHDAVRETVRQAWGKFLPDINANAEVGQVFQDVIDSDNRVYAKEKTNFFTQQYSLQVVQPIFALQNFYTYSQAKITLNRADFELLSVEQNLLLRVTDAYLAILLAQDEIVALKEEEAAIRMHYQVAHEKNQKGVVPLTDVYDAEARLEEVLAELVEAERALRSAEEALAEIIGSHPKGLKKMKPGFHLFVPDPDHLEHWLAVMRIKNTPLLVKRFESLEHAEEIKRRKAAHYPSLDLVGRWNWDESEGSLYGGGSTVSSFQVLGRLSIPLYSGGIIESRVRESASLYQKALKEITAQERLAARQVTDAFYGTKSAARRAGAAAKAVTAQELSWEGKQIGYESGRYDSLAVLDAIQDLANDRKNFNRFHYEHIIEFIKLKYHAGLLNEADIEQINTILH